MPEAARRSFRRESFLLFQQELLVQPDEEGTHDECLVLVVGNSFYLDDDVPSEDGGDVERVPAFEEPSRRAEPQAADAHVNEAADVFLDVLAVADLLDDLLSHLL